MRDLGQHERRRSAGHIGHDTTPLIPEIGFDHRFAQCRAVVLKRSRGIQNVAELVEEGPPELLAEVETLDLLLLPRRDVQAVLVEEANLE